MTDIPVELVVKLRRLSGQGMMDCKQALQEADGDMDKAMQILRKKGLATMAKRAERQAKEGLVVTNSSGDGRTVVLASLCCETDFVARTPDFAEVASKVAEYAMECQVDKGADELAQTTLGGRKLMELIAELISKTGEKIHIGDYVRYRLSGQGLIGVYVHFNHKVGSMVQIATEGDHLAADPRIKTLVSDLAMHVTATKPLAVDRDGIAPDLIEQERAIYAEQIKNKPAAIAEKIIEGKLGKFFAENCLLEQKFVKDDAKTVRQVVQEVGKSAGGSAKVVRFVRIAVGG